MRVLSLWQPWASLVKLNAKRVETRSWGTSYRGPVAIHAAKAWNYDCESYVCYDEFVFVLARGYGLDATDSAGWINQTRAALPFGQILCVAELVDCLSVIEVFSRYPMLDTNEERVFGNYGIGRFAWVLQNIRSLTEPIPFKGGQGLRTLPPEVERLVLRRAG